VGEQRREEDEIRKDLGSDIVGKNRDKRKNSSSVEPQRSGFQRREEKKEGKEGGRHPHWPWGGWPLGLSWGETKKKTEMDVPNR